MVADAETVVAGKTGFEGTDVAALFAQTRQAVLDCTPGLRRQSLGILDDLN
jgi:hypothetical protein